MIVLTNVKTIERSIFNEYEGLSSDDFDSLITKLDDKHVGSSFFAVDTGDIYKLNTVTGSKILKWYKL